MLKSAINKYIEKYGIQRLYDSTWLDAKFFERLMSGNHKYKFRKNNLDILYSLLNLERDNFYFENSKKWVKATDSILGDIFRKKRLEMCITIERVAKIIRVSERQIARIEAGDALPSFNSYMITKLIELYDFDLEESEKIRWFIVILRDLITINNNLEKKDIETVK